MGSPETERSDRWVYLVRHGAAKSKAQDPQRPLTAEGRAAVQRVATWAVEAGLKVDQIRHSGKLRARQTAEIFAEKLQPNEGIASCQGLSPNDDVRPVAEALGDCPCSVMLVGHLPFMSRLAGVMLMDDAEQQLVRFFAGGLVGLTREGSRWVIGCVVPPELVGEG